MSNEILLKMEGMTKSFSGVCVLDHVNFTLKKGSVHALLGENGAGKSTLMKILNGIYSRDEGEITYKGEKVEIDSPMAAKNLGIAMIHQEMSDFPDLTVVNNMFMGRELTKGIALDERSMIEEAKKAFAEFDFNLNPTAKVRGLSSAEIQLLEITKAVSTDSDVIIMDEPTSSITEEEVEKLFSIIRKLQSKGKAVIYISHKLDEIFAVCDELTVLRDGKFITTGPVKDFNKESLITAMVGRTLEQQFYRDPKISDEDLLKVENLKDVDGKVNDVSFSVRKGEIVGIAGLVGAGRTEMVETIFGLRKKGSGKVTINGKEVKIDRPIDGINAGIAFVPEDRKRVGLNLIGSLKENITLANLSDYCKLGVINQKQEHEICSDSLSRFSIKARNYNVLAKSLSGGNQQKVVLARWFSTSPTVMIIDEPTRGIDVGAKAEIYKLMDEFASMGNCVIMVSSELPEIMGMSDRIMVVCEGQIVKEFSREEATQEKILAAAAGLQ